MLFQQLRSRFGHHIRPLTHLFGSTGFMVLLPLATAPINSRLYDPKDFGAFALVTATTGVLTIPYVAGFAPVISLARSNEEATVVFRSLASSLALPCTLLAVACPISLFFGMHAFELCAVSILTFTLSSFSAVSTNWLVFTSSFKALSVARTAQTLCTAACTIAFGIMGLGSAGIIFGYLIGLGVLAAIFVSTVPSFRPALRGTYGALKSLMVSNKVLFVAGLPAEALNTVSRTLPTFLLNTFAGAAFLGLFNMANRLLDLPASLASAAVSQYFQGVAIKRNIAGQSLLPLVLGYSGIMALAGAPFVIIGTIYAPDIASWALGEEWRRAGEICQLLSAYVFLRTVVSPVTYVVFLRQAFVVPLIMDTILLCAVAAGLFVPLYVFKNETMAVISFSTICCISHIISFGISCFYAQRGELFTPR